MIFFFNDIISGLQGVFWLIILFLFAFHIRNNRLMAKCFDVEKMHSLKVNQTNSMI